VTVKGACALTQHDFTLSSARAFVSLAAILPIAMHSYISELTLKVIKIICIRHSSKFDESDQIQLRSHLLTHMRSTYHSLPRESCLDPGHGKLIKMSQ
jgi:hypothetical protein